MSRETEDLHAAAGAYVLGTISASERQRFEERLRSDEAARAALREARERFFALDLTAPLVEPSDELWSRIESRLDRDNERKVVDLNRHRRPGFRRGGGDRGAFWRGFAAAAVLALAIGAGVWRSVSPEQPALIVVLLDERSQPGAIIEAFGDQRVRVVPLERFNVPEGRTLQVWTLPNRETGPVSIGLLASTEAQTLVGPALPPPQQQQLYEITLEPAGGSPTGRPTGPIIAKGFARAPQI